MVPVPAALVRFTLTVAEPLSAIVSESGALTRQGGAVGEAAAVGDGSAVAVGDGFTVAVGDGLAVGLACGFPCAVGLAPAVGDGLAPGEGDADGEPPGRGV